MVVKLEMEWGQIINTLALISHVEISSYRKWGAGGDCFLPNISTPADLALFLLVSSQWLLVESSVHFPHSSLGKLPMMSDFLEKGFNNADRLKREQHSCPQSLLFFMHPGMALILVAVSLCCQNQRSQTSGLDNRNWIFPSAGGSRSRCQSG